MIFFANKSLDVFKGPWSRRTGGSKYSRLPNRYFHLLDLQRMTLAVSKENLDHLDHLIHLDYRWRWRGAQDELAWWGAHGRPHHGGVETGFQVSFKWTWTHKVHCTERNFETEVKAQVDIAIPKRELWWFFGCSLASDAFRPLDHVKSWPCCQGCRRSISCIAQTNVKLH